MTRTRPEKELRVLVIDDDDELAETMIATLRDDGINGWALRPVASAPGAIVAAAALFQPQVILVDVVMPVDTARLVHALRTAPELAGTSLIGCSGHAALAEGFQSELDGFLHKPFSRAELRATLREAVPPPAPPRRRPRPERPSP